MSKLTDRASYLKGLAEGMKLNTEKDANKLILSIIDLLADTTSQLDELTETVDELDDYVASMDEDLTDLADALCDEEDDEEDDDMEDGDELISYACPSCGHELQFRASDVDFDEDYLCPECGKPVFPELEEDEDADESSEIEESDDVEDPDAE